MFDHDLAELYGIKTKALVQALKRNLGRFPTDFMFQLNNQEVTILRSQSVTSRFWGGRRYNPYAFTEQGVAILPTILIPAFLYPSFPRRRESRITGQGRLKFE
jgi:hypothetical protein